MSNEQSVTKWLKENTNLSWSRVGGDKPPVKLDRLYINRSEGYEIRDLIIRFFNDHNVAHSENHYSIVLRGINAYRAGEKVKTEDMLRHLAATLLK